MVVLLLLLAVAGTAAPKAYAAETATVGLGVAGTYSALGAESVDNTGKSVLTGDVGVSPGSAITGFPPGRILAPGTKRDTADAAAAQAANLTAYTDAAGRPADVTYNDDPHELGGGDPLVAGVYKSNVSAGLTGTLVLDGQGDSSSVWIFQVGSALTTASDSAVILKNGAQACNVFWQVGSSATLGTSSKFVGTVLALTSITADSGTVVDGRLLAQTGAVTLDTTRFSSPECGPTATVTQTVTASPTATVTQTGPTATVTETQTVAPTATVTETVAPSATATTTVTQTVAPTATVTETVAPTATATVTQTRTATATATTTETLAPTATATVTETVTPTATETGPTATVTQTETTGPTATVTQTETSAPTATVTQTETVAPTATVTQTQTVGATATVTETALATVTATQTVTASQSATATATESEIEGSETATATTTENETENVTETKTATATTTTTTLAETGTGAGTTAVAVGGLVMLLGGGLLLILRRRVRHPGRHE